MKEGTLAPIVEWLGGNWGWALAIFCVFFEIAPIKLHPISSFLGWLGKKLTGDIVKDISDLKRDTDENFKKMEARLDENEKAMDMQRIATIRTTVLNFSNSCLIGRKHTKEEFDHVMDENKVYKKLIKKHNVENEVYEEAYAYIKRIYRRCQDEHKFLIAPSPDPEDLRLEAMLEDAED